MSASCVSTKLARCSRWPTRNSCLSRKLAGDTSYTLTDLAAAIATASGKPVIYKDFSGTAYSDVIVSFGLPKWLADMLADSDVGASKAGLFNDKGELRKLIDRPTTPLSTVVEAALKV